MNRYGSWVVEPFFEFIGYLYHDGLVNFYRVELSVEPDNILYGVYDIKQQKVIFEPQFLDIHFLDDGGIKVSVFDDGLGREIEKIIDREGKERFKSIYTYINPYDRNPDIYEVVILDEMDEKIGLTDRDGNVILPCKYHAAWNGIEYEQSLICFKESDKRGLVDFDGEIIIPPVYLDIYGFNEEFLIVETEEYDNDCNRKKGMLTKDGKTVLPTEYGSISWYSGHKHFYAISNGRCEMYVVDKNN